MLKGLLHSGSLSETERADVLKYKHAAWMCYLWLGAFYIYPTLAKKSPYLRHHARQGMIIGLVMTYFMFVPVFGMFFLSLGAVLQLYGMLQGHLGQYFCIPLIGKSLATNKTIAGIEEMIFNGGRLMREMKKASAHVKQAQSEISGNTTVQTASADTKKAPKSKEELLEEVYVDKPQWE